ncbi:MAG: signal peptide peptidase SppA [Candidatus Nanoarchaeia archaeon]|jgi:protease-4|nr:signal peptide peptidase SppA [Candidatus Nanoarchaeia archaeon]|tara:strand:+ start:743 stop:1630 length:888 start_codon:yes stop_codon:yes gene_type:complete
MLFKRKTPFRDAWWKKSIRIFGYIVAITTVFLIFTGPVEDSRDEVRIIPITGTIYSGSDSFSMDTFSDEVIAQIEFAQEDPKIKAVVLEINSPGGTVVGSREISTAVENFDKPIVAWMRENAASGAYWIASSTDHIVADPATTTGSIGVTGSYLQFSGLLDDYNVTYERFVSGEYKDTGTPFKEVSDNERDLLQRKINLLNDMFIDHIATSRNLSTVYVRDNADGQIFLGIEALNKRLVDSLGGKEEAINIAAEMAEMADYQVTKYERPTSFVDRLIYGKNNNELLSQTSFGARA